MLDILLVIMEVMYMALLLFTELDFITILGIEDITIHVIIPMGFQ